MLSNGVRQVSPPSRTCGSFLESPSFPMAAPESSLQGKTFSLLARVQAPHQSDEGSGPDPASFCGLFFRASVSISVTWASCSLPPKSVNGVVEGMVPGTEPGLLWCSRGGGSFAFLPLPPTSSSQTHPAPCPVPDSWLLRKTYAATYH